MTVDEVARDIWDKHGEAVAELALRRYPALTAAQAADVARAFVGEVTRRGAAALQAGRAPEDGVGDLTAVLREAARPFVAGAVAS